MYHRPKILLLLLCFVLSYVPYMRCYPSQQYLSRNEPATLFKPPELEETIEEVQKILSQDPTLPRLTRGEIEELYEKVTREEYQKSIAAGDMGRADSMRALMLVLPYNTDNNTEENLLELYTRPPVTKVIDAYMQPQPIQFITPDPNAPVKLETAPIGNFAATTYKPHFALKKTQAAYVPSPTTYHPPPPAPVIYKMATDESFQPVTNVVFTHDSVSQTPKPLQRYSSHYNAKNAEFLKQRKPRPITTTVRPVADVLESLGIVGQTQARHRFTIDDYVAAESAPQPVISTYVPQTVNIAELQGLRTQSLSPKIRPDAYSSFKPLNIGEEIRAKPEVEDYLTRFGIVGGRKRKELKKSHGSKSQNRDLAGNESEISTAKLTRKGTPAGDTSSDPSSQLGKLLENLQELERLNANKKSSVAPKPTASTITKTTTTTTTTTTAIPPTTANLITNGTPLLIEPKKPRRRIDPNIDINFANAGNQQTETTGNAEQLSKLLANLQELERLKINPENVLRTVATTPSRPIIAVHPTIAPTARTQTLTNRFSELAALQTQLATRAAPQQTDAQQLQAVLRQLQALEQANARTTTTKRPPQPSRGGLGLGLGGTLNALGLGRGTLGGGGVGSNDLLQLQRLLTDDSELERLYEQARAKQAGRTATTTRPPASTRATTTSTTPRPLILGDFDDTQLQRLFEQARTRFTTAAATTTTTTTTKKPASGFGDLDQLQKYFAELERARTMTTTTVASSTIPIPTTTSTTTTTTSTTPSTTSTTTTTSTTARPAMSSNELAQRIADNLTGTQKIKKAAAEEDQLQELINRVQQLERLNSDKAAQTTNAKATTTDTPLPFVGFTTRKINAPKAATTDYPAPSNDFAQLQQIYRQVADAEQASFGQIEISTAATASKPSTKLTQNFAQKIIDITNDTGSGSSLQEVDPNEFVQLQKLLSKVQELERVKINTKDDAIHTATMAATNRSYTLRESTAIPNLVTSASIQSNNVQKLNDVHVVLPEPPQHDYKPFEDVLKMDYAHVADERLESPSLTTSTLKPHVSKKGVASLEPTSSEELRELAMSVPANPKNSTIDKDFERYQEFFKQLEDEERNSYKNMRPPMIHKMVTKEPPSFIEKQKSHGPVHNTDGSTAQKADLEELQKLLNNAQQLEKLGVTLPTQLSQQIETKLTHHTGSGSGDTTLETEKLPIEANSKNELDAQLTEQVVSTTVNTPSTDDFDESSEKKAFISLTTPKSQTPREPKPTTASTLDLPIFSATKIIEAAIKRAANKIGVSTEQPAEGFRRRSDTDIYADMDMGMGVEDLMGEFSEMNYQLAAQDLPGESVKSAENVEETKSTAQVAPQSTKSTADITQDIRELQRLIGNLQELQRLNISASSELLRQADAKYLETFKKQQTPADETSKTRRQSDSPVIVMAVSATESVTTESPTTTAAPLPTTTIKAIDDDVDGESSETTLVVSTTPASLSSSSTTTEEPPNGSLADLEDSFGGRDTNKEEPQPPKRKNGFYFLADWNSFLEVGDGDDQVIVRLSPKIGDPRLFIPVKVP